VESPKTPDLYQVKLNIAAVKASSRRWSINTIQNVGFTNNSLEKDAVLVNGVPTLIKGVVWHEILPITAFHLTHNNWKRMS